MVSSVYVETCYPACVSVCVYIPRCVSTALIALINSGLLDSEYSTNTMRSFRDVFTRRRDLKRKKNNVQDVNTKIKMWRAGSFMQIRH